MDDKPFKLTSYPIGSLREMWTIAWPLMLGLLSSSIMIVVDRLLLARCSINYMNAAATGGTAAYSFFYLANDCGWYFRGVCRAIPWI